MKKLLCIMIVAFNTISCVALDMESKINVKVIEENGTPIENTDVTLGFQRYAGFNKDHVKGKTDKNGLFSVTGNTEKGMPIWGTKKGYYESGGKGEYCKSYNKLLQRWEPYPANLTITLRKKKNPVAMFAKREHTLKIPQVENGKTVGYDLEKGDWVTPHGKGIVSDFVFTPIKMILKNWNYYDCEVLISFSNEHDGIEKYDDKENIQSYYKWAYEAPQNGYKKQLKRLSYCLPPKNLHKRNIEEEAKYIFRVRTKVDEDGNIISAKYGKILGDFRLTSDRMSFTYYYNPDGTRNLEFDTEKNLFKFDKRKEWENMVKEP